MSSDSKPVKRFRRNDYVGPAIWGFHLSPGVTEGDRVHYDDHLFTPPLRSYYTVRKDHNGRLACFWEGSNTFAGYAT